MEELRKYSDIHNLFDIHIHLLPGLDDGARTMDETRGLIEQSIAAGFHALIATPHYSRKHSPERYIEAAEHLQKEFSSEIEIYLGQELYYHEELVEKLKAGKALTMAGSRYVLVEFDTIVSVQTLNRAIRQMLTAGYIPILAHMERYRCLRDERNLQEICRSGCLMQMNYESLAGNWFNREVRWCRNQVLRGRIQFLATDAHRVDYRPPKIGKAMKWLEKSVNNGKLNKQLFCDMTYRNAQRMIKNENIWNGRLRN